MKQTLLCLLLISGVAYAQDTNKFAEKINKSNDVEKQTLELQEKINKELIKNIAIKANMLKKTDENYMRAGVEKSLTGIYFENPLKGSVE